jgi:hypothetical protein
MYHLVLQFISNQMIRKAMDQYSAYDEVHLAAQFLLLARLVPHELPRDSEALVAYGAGAASTTPGNALDLVW